MGLSRGLLRKIDIIEPQDVGKPFHILIGIQEVKGLYIAVKAAFIRSEYYACSSRYRSNLSMPSFMSSIAVA